jgi:hypothetical protein
VVLLLLPFSSAIDNSKFDHGVAVQAIIAVLFKPPTSKQSYHHSIDRMTSIRMQKISSSPGKSYKNTFISHQV